MIWFNGFPYLDSKEEHIFNVPVSHAMTNKPVVLPATDFAISQAERLLENNKFQGFPIVEDLTSRTLVGFIGRTELQYAINRAKREGLLSPNAKCRFVQPSNPSASYYDTPVAAASSSSSQFADTHLPPPQTFEDIASSSGVRAVDFSAYVDLAPITVHPRLALETVMEIFKKMGPRVILVEHRGRLSGLVTVKDCLKYQFKVEHQELADANGADHQQHRPTSSAGMAEGLVEQKALEIIQWVVGKVAFWRKKRTGGLGRGFEGGGAGGGGCGGHERTREHSFEIVDGTEEVDGGDGVVELEEREDGRL